MRATAEEVWAEREEDAEDLAIAEEGEEAAEEPVEEEPGVVAAGLLCLAEG